MRADRIVSTTASDACFAMRSASCSARSNCCPTGVTSYQSQPQGRGRVKFVARQQIAHGVTPSGPLDDAQGSAMIGKNAATHRHLAETAILGGHDDICCQHQLDAGGKADALDRDDDRFGAEWLKKIEGIYQTPLGDMPPGCPRSSSWIPAVKWGPTACSKPQRSPGSCSSLS